MNTTETPRFTLNPQFEGESIKVFVLSETEKYFTFNPMEEKWECAPNNDRATYEELCNLAGFDPDSDEIILALNAAAGFIPYWCAA